MTRPPFSTIIRADAAPRPEAPPVTKAVLPSIRMEASINLEAGCRQDCLPHVLFCELEEKGLGVFFYHSPIRSQPQQGCQGALSGDECSVEIVTLHQDVPAIMAFEDLNVLLRHFFAEEITAAVDEDLLAWVEMKSEIVGPGVGGKDARAGYQIRAVADRRGRIPAIGKIDWPIPSEGEQRQANHERQRPDAVARKSLGMGAGKSGENDGEADRPPIRRAHEPQEP